jgi:hypothetical protein
MGTEPDANSSFAASPVLSAYVLGYSNETPEILSAYFKVAGALRTIFLCTGWAAAGCAGTTGVGIELAMAGGVGRVRVWLVELTGLDCSLEHPTLSEQTMRRSQHWWLGQNHF